MYRLIYFILILSIFVTGCKDDIVGPSTKTNLPDPMEISNGWEVVGNTSIPDEINVGAVEFNYIKLHGNQADAVFVTKSQLDNRIKVMGFRWQFNIGGSDLKVKEIPWEDWSINPLNSKQIYIYPKYVHSNGMGDKELFTLSSRLFMNTDSSIYENTCLTGEWSDRVDIEPHAILSNKPFLFSRGYNKLAKIIGSDHFIWYNSDVKNVAGGINSKGELVTIALSNLGQTDGASVYASTNTLSAQTLAGVNKLCYNSVLKSNYRFKDLSGDSLVRGADQNFFFQTGSMVYAYLVHGNIANWFQLNVENYTLKVLNSKPPLSQGIVSLIPEKPGHLIDVRNFKDVWYSDGGAWQDITEPVLKKQGTFVWNILYNDGYLWLFTEYQKSIVALRKKL